MPPTIPDAFTWGVATSAYQIEGGVGEGEKGESIWDRFAHTPGRILNGDTGDVACDHYHRWREDVALMSELGVDAYRFSIAWTRIIPDGTGDVSSAGIGFYDRLIDELLTADIEPYVTLYHWDLPQALEDRGGWPNRDIIDAFVEYADAVSHAFGDRVTHWITHNEPWVAALLGYQEGVHAPGRTDWGDALAAAHHILLSHGKAIPVIRTNAADAAVGIALDCRPSTPADDSVEAADAQRHFDGFRNRWFFDAVFGRGYPEDMVAAFRDRGRFDGPDLPFVEPDDLETIAAPIDFLGLNYYTSIRVHPGVDETEDSGVTPGVNPPDGHSEMGWESTPQALTDFLVRIHREYRPGEILITENGASYSDGPNPDGTVPDVRRTQYLKDHVNAVRDAIDAGVPVTGYFVWSLLDNFEWAAGYSQRFGLVWVDYIDGGRIPKDSYRWYRQLIGGRQQMQQLRR